jgi:hypothetical protein
MLRVKSILGCRKGVLGCKGGKIFREQKDYFRGQQKNCFVFNIWLFKVSFLANFN